jgi:hypothetical protein
MQQQPECVEVDVALPRGLYQMVERSAAAAGVSLSEYLLRIVRQNERATEDELAAEGYRQLGRDTLEFAVAAAATVADTWPAWRSEEERTPVRKSGSEPAPNTCRAEIIHAIRDLARREQRTEFTMAEILAHMRRRGTCYSEGSIRTYIGSDMCVNAPINNATVYSDLERVRRGVYRLRQDPQGEAGHAG